MSRKCPVTGKGPLSGNNRSYSLRATRRVQKLTCKNFKSPLMVRKKTVRMSTRAYRTMMKNSK